MSRRPSTTSPSRGEQRGRVEAGCPAARAGLVEVERPGERERPGEVEADGVAGAASAMRPAAAGAGIDRGAGAPSCGAASAARISARVQRQG